MQEELREKRDEVKREEGDNSNLITKVLREFSKSNPSFFTSSHNPIDTQNEINQIDKIFGIMQCTYEHKVSLVVFKLQGEAEYWWKGVKYSKQPSLINLSSYLNFYLT